MKLLVDENLALRLAANLSDLFPGSVRVAAVRLGSALDTVIWDYAGENQFTVLTKDKDFANLSLARGAPPKVVLLQADNCSTSQIEHLIRFNAIRFSEFEFDEGRALLVLRYGPGPASTPAGVQIVPDPAAQRNPSETRELWSSNDRDLWRAALDRSWSFVKPSHIALEKDMDRLDVEIIRRMDPEAWYRFLLEKYFRWKYTASNRYAATTKKLKEYEANHRLQDLAEIKVQLFAMHTDDIKHALLVARSIKGLGIAGASGLLAILFPAHFGTVDQFVVKALVKIPELPERSSIAAMNPMSLTLKDGVILIGVMRQKAAELNTVFSTAEWTPRKIDMVLWTCRE